LKVLGIGEKSGCKAGKKNRRRQGAQHPLAKKGRAYVKKGKLRRGRRKVLQERVKKGRVKLVEKKKGFLL